MQTMTDRPSTSRTGSARRKDERTMTGGLADTADGETAAIAPLLFPTPAQIDEELVDSAIVTLDAPKRSRPEKIAASQASILLAIAYNAWQVGGEANRCKGLTGQISVPEAGISINRTLAIGIALGYDRAAVSRKQLVAAIVAKRQAK